jgi:hypothetical protein
VKQPDVSWIELRGSPEGLQAYGNRKDLVLIAWITRFKAQVRQNYSNPDRPTALAAPSLAAPSMKKPSSDNAKKTN